MLTDNYLNMVYRSKLRETKKYLWTVREPERNTRSWISDALDIGNIWKDMNKIWKYMKNIEEKDMKDGFFPLVFHIQSLRCRSWRENWGGIWKWRNWFEIWISPDNLTTTPKLVVILVWDIYSFKTNSIYKKWQLWREFDLKFKFLPTTQQQNPPFFCWEQTNTKW